VTRSEREAEQGQQIVPSEERRRSQRVMIRVPVTLHVTLANQALAIRADTVAVNDYGAMLLCSRTLPAETKLEIQNQHTNQRLACRVTRTPQKDPNGFLIPVAFEARSPGFWHITFPPTDWKPADG
jgi:hypothetical protein